MKLFTIITCFLLFVSCQSKEDTNEVNNPKYYWNAVETQELQDYGTDDYLDYITDEPNHIPLFKNEDGLVTMYVSTLFSYPKIDYPKHTVTSGDTPSKIASLYGITTKRLYELNPGLEGRGLFLGDQLTTHDYLNGWTEIHNNHNEPIGSASFYLYAVPEQPYWEESLVVRDESYYRENGISKPAPFGIRCEIVESELSELENLSTYLYNHQFDNEKEYIHNICTSYLKKMTASDGRTVYYVVQEIEYKDGSVYRQLISFCDFVDYDGNIVKVHITAFSGQNDSKEYADDGLLLKAYETIYLV